MTEELQRYYESLKGKKVFFLGAGISHRDLIRRFSGLGAEVTLCDRKSLEDLGDFGKECVSLGVSLCLGDGYLDTLEEADLVFRTPGIDWTKPEIQRAVSAGVKITSEMESFFDLCPCRIIGVTGSDGKTTTTTLIARTLEAEGYRVHLGGNIGIPLFPVIDDVRPEDFAVVELSSFQLISMRKSPFISVVTNVTPNHLDHHKDMEEYVGAKKNIYLWQEGDSVSVFNAANDITRQMATEAKGEIRWFSRYGRVGNGAYVSSDSMLISSDHGSEHVVMDLKGIRLRGEHNKENVSTAYAAVRGLVSDSVFSETVSSFTGVEHRIEFVRSLNGVSYYNDSIASSPTRTIAGLRSFDEPIVLIAGGYDKKISYAPLAPEIVSNGVKAVLLCGDTADAIERELRNCSGYTDSIRIERLGDVPECVRRAREISESGDVVLFSPASASFDMYTNFEERGRHFKKLVEDLV
ncbi:MAG: UDP-N-acetylmuramoyl-L-alanine--D-glutamate ligase [Oscillospiraceae bacterium]|nr:UDP-N-acetylmuramoyl-L-alanine--D-glutamate ligase [Oscillospiraceae bacterium]